MGLGLGNFTGEDRMKRNIWFTGCTHFGNLNIIRYCDRPFKDVEEMDREMIKRWNKKVKKNDIVYILGDFVMNTCKRETYKWYMDQLNGIKILVMGNHDRQTIVRGTNLGFAAVVWQAQILIGKRRVNLSHYPYKPKWRVLFKEWLYLKLGIWKYPIKHKDKMMIDDGRYLCHAHTHQKHKGKGRQIFIGVEAWDFYPVHIAEIANIIEEREKA
jgi:calcineurin-like phosphoesterase family protein